MNELQHDDHCWLNVRGEAWAIRSIERNERGQTIFALWRGYFPHLQFKVLICGSGYSWSRYCAKAVEFLRAHQPLDEFITHRHKDIRA